MRPLALAIMLVVLGVEIFAQRIIYIRTKRQQCKCMKNPENDFTCVCKKPDVDPGSIAVAECKQQSELARQLAQLIPAKYACLQIVFTGDPQYQCSCVDSNRNLRILTLAGIVGSSLTTMTTTTAAPLVTTIAPMEQSTSTSAGSPGVCPCLMIRISPRDLCNCQNAPATSPLTTTTIHTSTLLSTTQSLPHETLPPATTVPNTYASITDLSAEIESGYPMTTTCVMFIGAKTTPCTCLPQYESCGQSNCCLKAKYRAYKNDDNLSMAAEPPSMLVNMLQKLQNGLPPYIRSWPEKGLADLLVAWNWVSAQYSHDQN